MQYQLCQLLEHVHNSSRWAIRDLMDADVRLAESCATANSCRKLARGREPAVGDRADEVGRTSVSYV